MRLTPRKNEITAIVAILESDEYDDAKSMAKAIIKQVADLFSERDWWAYAVRFGDMAVAWGPVTSETEVERLAKAMALGMEGGGVKLYSTERVLQHLEEGPGLLAKDCICRHIKGVHEHPKMGLACAVYGCPCQRYQAA